MGYIRRTHISHTMDYFRYPLLCYHHWYSVRRSVFQACKPLFLAYGQRDFLSQGRFWQPPWKHSLDCCFRLGTRPDTSDNRCDFLHHNHRHTLRPPMLQTGPGLIVPVRRYVRIRRICKRRCAPGKHVNL